MPPRPAGEVAASTQSSWDGAPEPSVSSVPASVPAPVVARLLGDGPLGIGPALPFATAPFATLPAQPGQPPVPPQQPVAQRVRWDRDEPGQPVVQRVPWQPAQRPTAPAGVELSAPPIRVDAAGIDGDSSPAYPTVNRAPDTPVVPVQLSASTETSPVPVSYLVQRVEQAGVPVTVQSEPEPLAAPAPTAPATEAAAASSGGAPTGGASAGGTAAGAPAGGAAAEPEELLKKLFDPLLRRLKTELRLDRERYGALTDRA
jgi:hypothetical protein